MAAGAGADQYQPVDALLQRLLGVAHADDVVQHDATIGTRRLHHFRRRAQRGDHDGHLVLDADRNVVRQAVVGRMHDLVDGEGRHLLLGVRALICRELALDAEDPLFEQLLGPLDDFLKRPHNEVSQLEGQIGMERLVIADFSHLPTRCKFIALMPQWEFLDFLAAQARRYPSFRLEMECEASDLIVEDGRIAGIVAATPRGARQIRADLVIGADGRHSTIRQKAGLEIIDLGAPIDVLWMRIPKHADDPPQTLGRIDTGRILVMLDRGDYWQCAFVIRKGGFEEVRQRGLAALRDEIARLAALDRARLEELRDWSDIKLLTVAVDRLRRWHRPGLLCIGDAAHAMW